MYFTGWQKKKSARILKPNYDQKTETLLLPYKSYIFALEMFFVALRK